MGKAKKLKQPGDHAYDGIKGGDVKKQSKAHLKGKIRLGPSGAYKEKPGKIPGWSRGR